MKIKTIFEQTMKQMENYRAEYLALRSSLLILEDLWQSGEMSSEGCMKVIQRSLKENHQLKKDELHDRRMVRMGASDGV